MTRDELEARIRELEELSRTQPRSYRRRVVRLALLGYAFLYGLLAACLLLVGLMVWLLAGSGASSLCALAGLAMLGVPLLGLAWLVAQSMSIRLPLPEGLPLTRRTAPNLFTAVDALTARLGAPPVHVVLLDHTLNAYISQRPRLGLFGWYRNYLVIGLPLMQALSPEQFGAVVAHETAHLSGSHARTGQWIYRVNRSWIQLLAAFRLRRKAGRGLLLAFLRWYVPKLDLCSFVLRRQDEYEADRISAEVAGARTAAEALMNVVLADAFLSEHFWPGLIRSAGQSPQPPEGVFPLLARTLPRTSATPDARRWLRQALLGETDCSDTHPCLAERLAALGQLAQADSALEAAWRTAGPQALECTAAQRYFGKSLDALTQTLERGWRLDAQRAWEELYLRRREQQRRFAALTKKREYGHLEEHEEVEYCLLTRDLVGAEQAVPLARNLVRQKPSEPRLRYLLGKMLLEGRSDEGLSHLEAAMENDLSLVFDGCELAYTHLRDSGREAEAGKFLRRAEQHHGSMRGAQRERDGLNASDAFKHHALSGDWVFYLQERLAELREVQEAFLVQKALKYFPDKPLFVLAIARGQRSLLNRMQDDSLVESLAIKIQQFPHPLILVDLARSPNAEAIRGVKKSRIYAAKPGR